jgi:serine/threonine protein phosphatase PrpC
MMVRSLFGASEFPSCPVLLSASNASRTGGKDCAEYISKTLPQTLARDLNKNENLPVAELITSAFIEVDTSLTESLRGNFKPFLTFPMPKLVRQRLINERLQRRDIREIVLRARSGTTALVAVVQEDYITLASVGDCRAGETFLIFLAVL